MNQLVKSLLLAVAAAGLLAPAGVFALPPSSGPDSASLSPGAAAPSNSNGGSPFSGQPAPRGATGQTSVGHLAHPAPVDSEDHLLMPGDLVEVKVFQEPDLDSTLRVAKDGSVVVPLIDRVSVGGITPHAAATIIRNLLDKDYIVNPQVNVRVLEYSQRSFTVLGEVQKPGSYDMPDRASVSLLEAIGMAGGYTRVANASNITVKRRVNDHETIFRLNAKKMAGAGSSDSFEIKPDDVVTVSESIF